MTDAVRELEEALALLACNGWHAEGTAGRRQVAVKRGWIEGEITLQADAARTLLGLALEALDTRQAASEAVTDKMAGTVRAVMIASSPLGAVWPSLATCRDALLAQMVAPALLLAGERRGLERAAEIARLSASVGAAMQQIDAALRALGRPA